MKQFLSLFVILCSLSLFAQKQKKLDALAAEFTQKSLPLLKEVLSIPNDAFYPDWIEQNVQWSEKTLHNAVLQQREFQRKLHHYYLHRALFLKRQKLS